MIIGLTIPIGADTKKFDAAIKKMDRNVKATSKDVRELSKSLKIEWNNGRFLQAQKQAKEAIEQTNVKAKSLRERLKYLDSVGTDKTSAEYQKLKSELIKTEGKAVVLRQKLKAINTLKFDRVAGKLKALGRSLSTIGRQMTTMVTLPILALGAASVKMALDFDTSFRKVSTLFGDVAVNSDGLKDKIKKLSIETGLASTELNEGLYQALSAGVVVTKDMTEAMTFLEIATSLARAGFTTTEKAVDAMTTVINAYGMSVEDAAYVSDILLATQNKGKTTVDELAGSISKVIPVAATLGVSFEDVAASLAALTAQGVPTEQATTALNQVFAQLGKSGTTASDILKNKTGKSFKELSEEGISLKEVFEILTEGAEGNNVAMIDLFGNIRAAKGFMSLTADEGRLFSEALDYVGNSAGLTGEALELMQGPQFELQQTLERLKTAMIELGNAFLPIVLEMAEKLNVLLQKFLELDEGTKGTIVKMLLFAAVLGPALLALGALVKGVYAAIVVVKLLSAAMMFLAANPIVLVLTLVVGLLALLYFKSEKFREAVNKLAKGIAKFIKDSWGSIKSFFQNFKHYFFSMINGVVEGASWMVNQVIGFLNNIIDLVNSIGKLIGINIERINEVDWSVEIPPMNVEIQPVMGELDDEDLNVSREGDILGTAPYHVSPSDIIEETNVMNDPQTVINQDYSDKEIKIEIIVQNYGEEIDVDKLAEEINLKLASQM